MHRVIAWGRRNLQAILAFSLLVGQMSIPWTVSHFVTQDGPSHLYTATVARNLIFHPHSEYAQVYAINRHVVPNWGTTVVLGLISSIAGPARAEQIFVSLSMAAGFFAFAYAIRAIAPEASRWTPLTNFLLQTWFLWVGYDNFYLAMVLCPWPIGYYIRHAAAFTRGKALALAAGMCALFLTHLIPAAMAGLIIGLIAVWVNRTTPRRIAPVILALIPVAFLFFRFARSSAGQLDFTPRFIWALENFPMHVFVTSSGRAGDQSLLVPAVLCFIVLAIVTMTRMEWRTARGGLAVSAIAVFLLYLLIPDAGFGGKEAKIRFAWGVFVIGGLLLATAPRLYPLRVPFDVYVFALLITTLGSTAHALRNYSHTVEDYLAVTKVIPHGARFARLRYPTPDIPDRYGFPEIGRDPLFHLDSYVAAQCECVDVTDYQAPTNVFPVVFNRKVPDEQRRGLWSFEGPGPDAEEVLKSLRYALPGPVDYVIVVAEQPPPVAAWLDSEMRLVMTSGGNPFVRVYARR